MSISTRALSKSNARGLRQRRHDKLGCGEVIADRFVQPCCVHAVHRRYPARMPRGSVSRTQCHSRTVGTGRTGLLAGASREAAAPLARSGGGEGGFGRTGKTPPPGIRGGGGGGGRLRTNWQPPRRWYSRVRLTCCGNGWRQPRRVGRFCSRAETVPRRSRGRRLIESATG